MVGFGRAAETAFTSHDTQGAARNLQREAHILKTA